MAQIEGGADIGARGRLNARAGAIALAAGAGANLALHVAAPALLPLAYLAWLAVTFGVLCFCDEMGAARPLNRAGLVLFAAAFCAAAAVLLAVDPAAVARARLLYAFAVLGALALWSVAMMHRRSTTRVVGVVGASAGLGALGLLIGAHLLLGTATIFGFTQLFSALDHPAEAASAAPTVIDALLAAWALPAAALLWTGRLRG